MTKNDTIDWLGRLEGALAIDQSRLDDALLGHSDLFYQVVRKLVAVSAGYEDAKTALDDVTKDVVAELTAKLQRKGVRVVLGRVRDAAAADGRVRAFAAAALARRHRLDRWLALKEAYQQRSFMLRSLVDLYVTHHHNIGLAHRVDLEDVRANEAGHYARLGARVRLPGGGRRMTSGGTARKAKQ